MYTKNWYRTSINFEEHICESIGMVEWSSVAETGLGCCHAYKKIPQASTATLYLHRGLDKNSWLTILWALHFGWSILAFQNNMSLLLCHCQNKDVESLQMSPCQYNVFSLI